MNIDEATARYIAQLNKKGAEMQLGGHPYCTFEAQPGQKYIKIMQRLHQATGGSVHSFVVIADDDKGLHSGDLLKAAGFNAPAKGVRGNIITGWDALESRIDITTGYLYKNKILA